MLIALHVENHAKKKKKSWKDDESCLRRLLQPKYGSRPVNAITTADIEAIHANHDTTFPIAGKPLSQGGPQDIPLGLRGGRPIARRLQLGYRSTSSDPCTISSVGDHPVSSVEDHLIS